METTEMGWWRGLAGRYRHLPPAVTVYRCLKRMGIAPATTTEMETAA